MTSNSSLYLLGAAMVGIVSAAGVFIAEHFRQERRRHAMAQDLARLDQQLSGVQKELEQLRLLQKENFYFQFAKTPCQSADPVDWGSVRPDLTYRVFIRSAQRLKKAKRPVPKQIGSLSTASDDYSTAFEIDSSDMEFYDLSDDETTSTITSLEQTLKELDDKLNSTSAIDYKESLDRLTDLCLEYPENPELLWRIGKAHHKLNGSVVDSVGKRENIDKGLAACDAALRLNPRVAEAHKWYAILVGSRCDMQPIKEKISDGFVFKEHLDVAVALSPTDPTLRHMLGRFAFETASLKWYERKVAATFFAEPPTATVDEALEHFVAAEKLMAKDWKENKLLIGKCLIALGRYQDAMDTLAKADEMENDSSDTTIEVEVKALLQKYNSYR